MEPRRQYSRAVLSDIFWQASTCVQGIAHRDTPERERYRHTFTGCAELLRRCRATHEHSRVRRTGIGPLLESRRYEEALIVGTVIRELWHPDDEKEDAILAHLVDSLDRLAGDGPLAEDAYHELSMFMSALYRRCASRPGPVCGVPIRGTPDEFADD